MEPNSQHQEVLSPPEDQPNPN